MHKHGLNEITATIENKLKERRFEEVNSVLKSLDIRYEELRVLMTYLITTFSYNKELPYRREFYEGVCKRAKECKQYEENWFKVLGR
ncbi:hypothetical protein J4414_03735 [Candidatus Woesearchaeota archaeon]|nr:hypothetical protein [Candidatus Woesearchaeota archaeon]